MKMKINAIAAIAASARTAMVRSAKRCHKGVRNELASLDLAGRGRSVIRRRFFGGWACSPAASTCSVTRQPQWLPWEAGSNRPPRRPLGPRAKARTQVFLGDSGGFTGTVDVEKARQRVLAARCVLHGGLDGVAVRGGYLDRADAFGIRDSTIPDAARVLAHPALMTAAVPGRVCAVAAKSSLSSTCSLKYAYVPELFSRL